MLLDTPSMYFRAFHGLPETLVGADGRPVNAVRGLLDMIAHLIAPRRPDRLGCCFDADWRPAFRVRLVPSYKAHRLASSDTGAEAVPPALTAQLPLIVEVLDAIGLARAEQSGYEADDVIATLVEREIRAGRRPVEVVTGDRDLLQLVDDDAGARVLYIGRGVRRLEVVDQAALATRYGVSTGARYADLALLRGDPSDGLPGVPGVGEKTAASLVERLGSAAAVRAAATRGGELAPALARRIREADAYLEAAADVVRVARDAPVPVVDDALPRDAADPQRLLDLIAGLALASPMTRLAAALGWAGAGGSPTAARETGEGPDTAE